jgi:hypothetical protein
MMPENIPEEHILPTRDLDFLALAASNCQQNGKIAGATLGFTAAN